ncbi:VOC family protein [Actinomadura adrarensis]|uniref:VOC family protein n=1 Tax=Actinomadura adrarensis TaxID=1819600 RepID=A0ABW3CPU8_9ACTN
MAGSHLRLRALVIDSVDPERLVAFWSELLGKPVVSRTGPYVWLESDRGLTVGFQKVLERKSGKNRVHFDVESPDPASERPRIEALGGRYLTEYADAGFLVMADPEGNEFCVIPTGPVDLDDEGRAHYL